MCRRATSERSAGARRTARGDPPAAYPRWGGEPRVGERIGGGGGEPPPPRAAATLLAPVSSPGFRRQLLLVPPGWHGCQA